MDEYRARLALSEELRRRKKELLLTIFRGGEDPNTGYIPGEITRLANQLKQSYDDEHQWMEEFVYLLYARMGMNHVDIIRRSAPALEELMDVFPELIGWKLGGSMYSLMDICFSRIDMDFTSDQILYLSNKIMESPRNTKFELQHYNAIHDEETEHLDEETEHLDENCMKAISILLSKFPRFVCNWHGWTQQSLERFIQILFSNTTAVKEFTFGFDYRNPNINNLDVNNNTEFSQSIEQLLTSLVDGEINRSCTIEKVQINIRASGCPLLPFLAHMDRLKTLEIRMGKGHGGGGYPDVSWHHVQNVVSQDRLESLTILGIGSVLVDPIPPMLESNQNSTVLKKLRIDLPGEERDYRHRFTEPAVVLKDCLVGILEKNTTLTDVRVYDTPTGSKQELKIRYLSHLNRHGRGKIQHDESTTVMDLMNMLVGIPGCRYPYRWGERFKLDMVYGILRERPSLWIPKRSSIVTNANAAIAVTGKKRKRVQWF